ncbi:MAG: PhnB protein [Acidimicrobiia bacterium]|nr:PhnB protein [Acidimicrobiia bacterium]
MGEDTSRHPASVPSIAPWLLVPDADAAIAFYREAFGAAQLERLDDEAGSAMVAQLSIGGAEFWVQADDVDPDTIASSPVRMILTVADPDATFARALAANGKEIAPLGEEHGWRIGRIADPSGHHWEIGRRLSSEDGISSEDGKG